MEDAVVVERRARCMAGACRRSFQYCLLGGVLLLAGELRAAGEPGASGDDGWLPRLQQAIAEKEYEVSPNGGGLQAPNRAHNLRTYFETTGIRVVDLAAAGSPELLELRLVGVGRGAEVRPVAPGDLSNEGTRVEMWWPAGDQGA